MSYFLDFDHVVGDTTPDRAYAIVESWLREEKSKVKESRPPTRIVAAHGRALQPMGWRKDARKTIAFELAPEGSNVRIRVRITPAALNATDVRMRSDEARANWSELLADLWTRFGETKAAIEATQTAPVDWNASLRAGKGTVLVGVVLLGIGIAITAAAFASGFVWFGTGFIVAGVLSLMYGAMTVVSARRRLLSGGPRSGK